jgi:transposase-like protein
MKCNACGKDNPEYDELAKEGIEVSQFTCKHCGVTYDPRSLTPIEKYWDRETWLHYIMGFLTAKGFKIRKVYVESFKKAFPEIPNELVDMVTLKE